MAGAAYLRRRRAAVAGLPAPPSDAADEGDGLRPEDLVVVAAEGVEVDAATRVAVAHEMTATGAEVVDLLPGDLPAEAALRALVRVDPDRLGTDPLYAPGGGHEALVLHPSVARRMGVTGDETTSRAGVLRRTVEAQRCASLRAVVRVAPGVRSGPWSPGDRWREIEELTAPTWPSFALTPAVVAAETLHLLALTAGLLVAPGPAAAAVAAWSAQPALALGPQHLLAGALRLPRRWSANVRTALVGARDQRAAAARAATVAPDVPPADKLFEERRETCPWCDSPLLVGRLDTTDLFQHKPGAFHLDECRACGHVFQNPALTVCGLGYYYGDFYEGAGGDMWASAFAAMEPAYRGRVEAMARHAEPRTWLDVGAGHGHFCLVARRRWPEARFDGLDLGPSISEASRRGWIDRAHHGLFPDLADGLPSSYDVVSMHHYLEHTRDPRRELAAAMKVLEPGGHLMIEVPDPESPWARRLGRYWTCWFQPQHQHLVPCHNLVRALEETGFDVVSVERASATMGLDLVLALVGAVGSWAPSPHYPWRPRPSLAARATRLATMTAMLPALGALLVTDVVKDALARRTTGTAPGNAYRVIARRH